MISQKLLASTLFVFTILGAASSAQDRVIEIPNLSGTWRFIPDESELEIEEPETVVYAIRHSMTHFEFERTMRFEDDVDKLKLELKIGDAMGKQTEHEGASLLSRVRMEANELVLEMKIDTRGRITTRRMRFRSEKDGEAMVVEEEFIGGISYENRWVFEKVDE